MTPAQASRKEELERCGREKFNRVKRLNLSIADWEQRDKEVSKMLGLLKEALQISRDELAAIESELGFHIKE